MTKVIEIKRYDEFVEENFLYYGSVGNTWRTSYGSELKWNTDLSGFRVLYNDTIYLDGGYRLVNTTGVKAIAGARTSPIDIDIYKAAYAGMDFSQYDMICKTVRQRIDLSKCSITKPKYDTWSADWIPEWYYLDGVQYPIDPEYTNPQNYNYTAHLEFDSYLIDNQGSYSTQTYTPLRQPLLYYTADAKVWNFSYYRDGTTSNYKYDRYVTETFNKYLSANASAVDTTRVYPYSTYPRATFDIAFNSYLYVVIGASLFKIIDLRDGLDET